MPFLVPNRNWGDDLNFVAIWLMAVQADFSVDCCSQNCKITNLFPKLQSEFGVAEKKEPDFLFLQFWEQ